MRPALYLTALILAAPTALHAQMAEEDAYRRLAAGLQQEVELLAGIVDKASAEARLKSLSHVMKELAALNKQVADRDLWRYIENTPDVKQHLIETTEALFVELQRLEKAQCFQHAGLKKLLAPMFSPVS